MMIKTWILVSVLAACQGLPQNNGADQIDAIFGPKPTDNQNTLSETKPTDQKTDSQDGGDLDSIIKDIFSPEVSSGPGKRSARSGEKAPAHKPHPVKEHKCTLENGQLGKCVAYYLCQDKVEVPPAGFTDSRLDEKPTCESYIDVCCTEKGIHHEHHESEAKKGSR